MSQKRFDAIERKLEKMQEALDKLSVDPVKEDMKAILKDLETLGCKIDYNKLYNKGKIDIYEIMVENGLKEEADRIAVTMEKIRELERVKKELIMNT